MKKYIKITLFTLTLLTCFTGCGKKESSGKSKTDKTEAQTPVLSTVAATDKEHRDEDQDKIQKALEEQKKAENNKTSDEPESGIIKHTDRPYEGYYLEDYITVNFKGYEHDSECEVIVDWGKLADVLGNGVTPEILESIYNISVLNTDDRPLDHTKVNDLVNGDKVELSMSEKTLQDTFKQKYTKELKYIDDSVYYYEKTPVIVSGLKTKAFLENTSDIDKTAIQKITDKKMNGIKDLAKDYVDNLEGGDILSAFDWKPDIMGNTHYIKINDFKIDKRYFAKRTASSYNDVAASTLPENTVFSIYKLTVERYGTGEILDLYYRAEIGNLLYEDGKMIISDDTVKVQFAATAEELMPDSQYLEIKEVK